MPRQEIIINSFTAGELSPYMLGRTDLNKYHNGCESIINFIVRYTGGVSRRPGFRYIVDASGTGSTGPPRLIPFIVSETQAFILEVNNNLIRFYTNDGQVQSGGTAYQIGNPYNTATDNLWDIKYVQIASSMYLIHANRAPQKLIRFTDTNWKLVQPSFYSAPTSKQNQDVSTIFGAAITINQSVNTITGSAAAFMAGDVGRYIVAGSGRALITAVSNNVGTDTTTGATMYTVATVNITNPFDKTSYPVSSWFLSGGPLAYLSIGTFNSNNNQWTGSKRFGVGKSVNAYSTTGHPTDKSWETVVGTSTVPVTYGGGFTDAFRTIDVGAYVNFAGGYGIITSVISSTQVSMTVLSVPTVTEITAYSTPIISPTPPGVWQLEFAEFGVGNYPRAVAFFQDRLWFASTPNNPQTIWGSVVGDYENFALGVLDTAGVRFTINSGELETILWLEVYQGNIVAGTYKGEYIINGGSGQLVVSSGSPITPNNINVIRQSKFGNSKIQPIMVENDLFFIQRSAQKAYQFAYNPLTSGFGSKDLTLYNEIITTSQFKEMAYQQQPFKIIWLIDVSGNLVGLTYVKEQDVWAWHRHNTGTDFGDNYISIATIPNIVNGIALDELWAVVKRQRTGTINNWYSIELLDTSLYVDAGSHTIFSSPVTSVSGLSYLNGRSVFLLADGALLPSKVMDSTGIYTFPVGFSAKDVQAGLNYNSTLTTVRPEPKTTIQGLIKRWLKVWSRIYQSLGITIGGQNVPLTLPTNPLATGTPLFTGDVQINNQGYDRDGRITISQNNPLPCNVLCIMGNIEISDGV